MQYLIQIYNNGSSVWEALSEGQQAAVSQEYMQLNEDAGVRGGAQLQPPETATTVRVEDGRTLTTDGPFADTKEVLGGLYLLEADNLDRALELAARIPAGRMGGAVEVRPLVER